MWVHVTTENGGSGDLDFRSESGQIGGIRTTRATLGNINSDGLYELSAGMAR